MPPDEPARISIALGIAIRSGVLVVVLTSLAEIRAQSPTPATAEPLPPIFIPRQNPPTSTPNPGSGRAAPRTRAISSETSAKIFAALAHAAPREVSAPLNTAPPPPSASADAVVMAPYIVEEDKEPKIIPRDMLTEKGKFARVYDQYPGLKAGRFSLGNGVLIREIVEDQLMRERVKEMAELNRLAAPPAPPKRKKK